VKRSDFDLGGQSRLVDTLGDHCAFVPPSLPPDVTWTTEIVLALSAADRAIGKLSSKADELPNPHLLIGPFVRREAVLSSRIEGTVTDLRTLYLFEMEPEGSEVPDAREVANYVRAMEYGLQRCEKLPVCLRLIRELHKRLMHGVRGQDKAPGQFRKQQNCIGRPNCSLEEATFVPPPPKEMLDALDRFERFLHATCEIPPLIRLAMIHYQFEAIHPFGDGNGRIGRLLTTLLMCAERLLPQPLLYLSAYFEENRDEYYCRLLEVSTRECWQEWFLFFLRGVVQQSLDAVERARRLQALREELRNRLTEARTSALLPRLVDELFRTPVISAKAARQALGASDRATRQNIARLVDGGVLTEITGRRRNRLYVAEPIIRAIEEPYSLDTVLP